MRRSKTEKIVRIDCSDIEVKNKKPLKLTVSNHITYGHVLDKIRRVTKLDPSEGLYLMILNDLDGSSNLPKMSQLVSDIPDNCHIKIFRDSVFGALSKSFVKASIKKVGTAYVAKIVYSYFGIYHYEEMEAFASVQEAKDHILGQRTDGHLSIET